MANSKLHPSLKHVLQPSAEESMILRSHAQRQIRKFLERLAAQKQAELQAIPGIQRMKMVPAFTLPPQYDPHLEKPLLSDADLRKIPSLGPQRPLEWDPHQALVGKCEEGSHQLLCSNVALIDFSIGPLAEIEAGDWTKKFVLPQTTSITSHTGYWKFIHPHKKPILFREIDLFAYLQHICTEARLMECSSRRCEAARHILAPIIPNCKSWPSLRKWVLIASSCQLAAIAENYKWLIYFNPSDILIWFKSHLDGFNRPHQRRFNQPHQHDLAFDVLEILWFHASQVHDHLSIHPSLYHDQTSGYAQNDSQTLPSLDFNQGVFHGASQKALTNAKALKICRKRMWDLAFMAPRKLSDLPGILEIIQSSSNPAAFAHEGHIDCSPESCELADENSTLKEQLHKCSERSCHIIEFSLEKLDKLIYDGRQIAWKVDRTPSGIVPSLLNNEEIPERCKTGHLALSHVWSDGTGVGVKGPGEVNECLVRFFFDLAERLDCCGLWWDTICIPREKKARSIAISKMHENYTTAKHTLVHDEYLLQIDWAEDGSPAIAFVLSPWFSRGWTALELSSSLSVKVLYRNPKDHSSYVLKDLDRDILAGPLASLGHAAATALILRIRGRPSRLMDLLTILSTRSTSWSRDRIAIAGLLAGVENLDYNSSRAVITRQILGAYLYFDKSLLHHGQATLTDLGPFSWCPSNLLQGPQELFTYWDPVVHSKDYGLGDQVELCVDRNEFGSVLGFWSCTVLNKETVQKIQPVAKHLSVYTRIRIALDSVHPECLVVLHSGKTHLPDLLVVATGAWCLEEEPEISYIDCHYVGCVKIEKTDLFDELVAEDDTQAWKIKRFKLGCQPGRMPCTAAQFLSSDAFGSDYPLQRLPVTSSTISEVLPDSPPSRLNVWNTVLVQSD